MQRFDISNTMLDYFNSSGNEHLLNELFKIGKEIIEQGGEFRHVYTWDYPEKGQVTVESYTSISEFQKFETKAKQAFKVRNP